MERTAATIHILLLTLPPSLKLSCHFSSLHLGRLVYRVLRLPFILGTLMELGLGRGITVFGGWIIRRKWDGEVAYVSEGISDVKGNGGGNEKR